MNFSKNQKGSLLILVLFSLIFLSLLALSVGYAVRQKMDGVRRLEARENLRLAAEAAVQQASLLLLEKGEGSYSALNQPWANNASLWKSAHIGAVDLSILARGKKGAADALYGLTDEDRKINLNHGSPRALQLIFENVAHVEKEDARRIVSAIRDWVDEDEDLNEGGAESQDYLSRNPAYGAKNGLFNDLQELLWIQGMTPEIFSKVKHFLTLDASSVNVNTASQEVLIAMGLNSNIASKIIQYRAGKDDQEGTADDGVFKSLDEIADVLSRTIYLNEADLKNLEYVLSQGFSVNSSFFNAEIDAQVNHRQSIKVNAILDDKGKVQRWHEDFF